MKIAILYTGQWRTVEQTLPHVQSLFVDDLDKSFDVFACMDIVDSNLSDTYSTFLKSQWKSRLKSIDFSLSPSTSMDYIHWRDDQLDKMNLPDHQKNYLQTSGSMLEYVQLKRAYGTMLARHTQYNYILRLRGDVMITQPIPFDRMHSPILENITNEWNSITKYMISFKNKIAVFMSSLVDPMRSRRAIQDIHCFLNDDLIHNIQSTYEKEIHSKLDDFYKQLLDYILHGNYVITFRKNVFYMGNPHSFSAIPLLGLNYGEHVDPGNDFWWNAESQFESVCRDHKITIFDSTTVHEDKSLYDYNATRYFDSKGRLKPDNDCFFFIQRHS